MGPDLLRAFAWGWSAHLLLGEQPFPQRATRESSHRLKVSIAIRTPSEYGEFDGCTPLNSVATPLADELDERGHPTTYSGPTERCLHSIAEGRQRGARRPRDAKAASVEAASADGFQRLVRRHRCQRAAFASTPTNQRFRILREKLCALPPACSEPF